jgi:hypothetical protein
MATGILPFITIESHETIVSPPTAVRKERRPTTGRAEERDGLYELDEVLRMGPISGSPSLSQTRSRILSTPSELEMSQPPGSTGAADVIPNLKRFSSIYSDILTTWLTTISSENKWRFASACLMGFINGTFDQ